MSDRELKIPRLFVWSVTGICVLPFLLNLIGFDFGSQKRPFDPASGSTLSPGELADTLLYTLSGSFTHTILEWSAFCTAIFIVIKSFVHFHIKRDVTTPIIGLALFCAGFMDAFHTLAADRLIEATADNENLIPFTGAISRAFNALILIVGVGIVMLKQRKESQAGLGFVLGISLLFGFAAYAVVHFCAISDHLPQTMFPDSIITRPWDVAPLILFIFAGVYVFPSFHKRVASPFSHALMISVIPQVATQLYMAFGSTALFDNNFNVAHFLKILAYFVPFVGLSLDYIRTSEKKNDILKKLEVAKIEIEVANRTLKHHLEEKWVLASIVENTDDAIKGKSLTGEIISWNKGAENMYGYSEEEILGQHISILIPEDRKGESGDFLKMIKDGKKIDHFETVRLRKDGASLNVSLTISPIKDSEGNIIGASTIARDITQWNEIQKALTLAKIEAETANRAKSEFLANMSHEIRTPMNAILGYAQILSRDSLLGSNQQKSVRRILSGGDHLLNLINDILDLSKIEAGRMDINAVDFNLNDLVKGISAMFRLRCEEKHLAWLVDGLENDCVMLHGDETKIRQVLINLAGNAVKFTDSGQVRFSVRSEGDGQYRFEVSDTGKGISMEVQKSILDPFHQGSEGLAKGGTGLGLAIADSQIKLMGGELELKSATGKGASFFFSLKIPPAQASVQTRSSRSQKKVVRLAKGFHVKVLVVDDVQVNRDVLSELLLDIGAEVITAENGKDAVEKVRIHHPDIVFMDLRMPVMDGWEATRVIKNDFAEGQIKTVAITASVFQCQQEASMQLGCDRFISKPFRANEIFDCLKELLLVEFEYEEERTEKVLQNLKPDLSKICLSGDIHARLRKGAELYSVTDIENILVELAQASEEGHALAEYLRSYMSQYDMDGILKVLEEVNCEG